MMVGNMARTRKWYGVPAKRGGRVVYTASAGMTSWAFWRPIGELEMQNILMKFDPATGEERPYPSHATQWRNWHGTAAWLFDPWTGKRRNAYDVGSDVHGLLIAPAGTLGMDMGGGCATITRASDAAS